MLHEPDPIEPVKGRVLTGDRPTGALHLGHYFGTIANRVRLQNAGHEVFIVIADFQVIADRDHPGDLPTTVSAMVLDYLACGMDPARTVIYPHSQVPALNQLLLPFLSLVGMGELTRNPTVKEEIRLAARSSVSGLMLTYPVHQAADVLFCEADLVPVGRDQLPHLELTRSIARRFNDRYGAVFRVPQGLLSDTPMLAGLDGRKMAKSQRNGITLRDTDDEISAKVRGARTDSERSITFEPARRPEVANLLSIAGLCRGVNPDVVAASVGNSGSEALKDEVIDSVISLLRPIRERRARYSRHDVDDVVQTGIARATRVANSKLDQVRTAMGMDYRNMGGLAPDHAEV
jgi:tryptophanyl-tRNA synthetase